MKRIPAHGAMSLRPLVSALTCAVVLVACDARRTDPATPPAASPAPAVTPSPAPASPPGRNGSSDAPQAQEQQTGSTGSPPGSMGGKAAVSAADVEFVASAASAGTLEVEASRVALAKTKSPAVRIFAQKMMDEHSKAGAELRALTVASSVGNVAAMTPTDGAELRRLQALQGRDFDRAYVARLGVAAHQDAVGEFQKAAAGASDPQVRRFAQAKLPLLREHLKMAEALAKQVGANTASSGPESIARSK